MLLSAASVRLSLWKAAPSERVDLLEWKICREPRTDFAASSAADSRSHWLNQPESGCTPIDLEISTR